MTRTRDTLSASSDNVHMSRLGQACDEAASMSAGDSIDRGLGLLRVLESLGYEVRPKPETWPYDPFTGPPG